MDPQRDPMQSMPHTQPVRPGVDISNPARSVAQPSRPLIVPHRPGEAAGVQTVSTETAQTAAQTSQPATTSIDLEPQPEPGVWRKATANDRHRSIMMSLRGFLSFVIFVATVVIAAMLINQFVFQSYYVDGTSMNPTLENNDRLIIDKTGKTIANVQGKTYIPKRGDIVILDSTILDQFGHDEQLIKRVIGLPGETVHIQDGTVTIHNAAHPEGFNADAELGLRLAATYIQTSIDITVPENSVYVLGDNRAPNGSFDSRSFGTVSADKIQGKLALRIFPFNRMQTF